MFRRDADQLSDTTVLLWDAVASGQPAPAPGEQAATFDLISNFLALDDAPMPDAAFLSRLEAQVIDAGTQTFALQDNPQTPLRTLRQFLPGSWRAVFPPGSPPRSRLSSYGHWMAAQAAMVILLLITAGGIGVVYLTGQPDQAVTTIPSTGGGDLGYAGGETGAIPPQPSVPGASLPATGGDGSVPAPTVEPSEMNLPATGGGGPAPAQSGGEPAAPPSTGGRGNTPTPSGVGSANPPSTGGPGNAATPPGTPEVESLLNAVIDPAAVGAVGQSEWATASLFSFSLEPGEGFALDREAWGSSLNVFTMLRGELSVQSGSSSLVFRRGSSVPETVNAGERVTIVVGDSWVAGFDTDVSGQNDGTSGADVLIHANSNDWNAIAPPISFPGSTPRGDTLMIRT